MEHHAGRGSLISGRGVALVSIPSELECLLDVRIGGDFGYGSARAALSPLTILLHPLYCVFAKPQFAGIAVLDQFLVPSLALDNLPFKALVDDPVDPGPPIPSTLVREC